MSDITNCNLSYFLSYQQLAFIIIIIIFVTVFAAVVMGLTELVSVAHCSRLMLRAMAWPACVNPEYLDFPSLVKTVRNSNPWEPPACPLQDVRFPGL